MDGADDAMEARGAERVDFGEERALDVAEKAFDEEESSDVVRETTSGRH